jgi:hypothetical protein
MPIGKPLVLRPASEAAPDQLASLETWNRAGKRPTRIGFARALSKPIKATFGNSGHAESAAPVEPHAVRAITEAGSVVWATKVTITGAYGIRLHLTDVHLPAGTRFWTYSPDGSAIAFGLEMLSPSGDIWTPTVFDHTAFLEVEIPSAQFKAVHGFVVSHASEMVTPSGRGKAVTGPLNVNSPLPFADCLEDAACITAATFGHIAQARKAVAHLDFLGDDFWSTCTGTLLNNTRSDFTPYLLTAHHCIASQEGASSLTAYWDFVPTTCGGSSPSLDSLPRSNGGTFLAGARASDFSLIRLFSIPPDRALMGWDARATSVGPGTRLFRVSHPAPAGVRFSQSYAETNADMMGNTCPDLARPQFLYSSTVRGDIYGGSSGSAAMLEDGSVVGQLFGICPPTGDSCAQSHSMIDGAFSQSYPVLAQWLDPAGVGQQACLADADTLCLNNGRFRVVASWQTSTASGSAKAVTETTDTGMFWFFSANNIEMIIKVVNGCALNSRYWVFAGGMTNAAVTMTVTDTRTGAVKSYPNSLNTAFQPVQDTSAFATCP